MIDMPNEYGEQYFRVSGELEARAGLRLVRLGRSIAKPTYQIGPKVIPHYGLHLVLTGSLLYECGGNRYELHGGDVFCLFPNEIVAYRILDPASELRLVWLTLYGDAAPELLRRTGLDRSHPTVAGAVTAGVPPLLDELLRLAQEEEGGNHDLPLLSALFRLFAKLAAQRTPTAPDNPQHDWLKRGMDYIHMHFRDAIKVNDVARFVGVDRTHFTRTFHQAHGISPHAYVQSLKLAEAHELLQSSGMSIKEIAASLGYSDPYTFSRAFKRKYGCTPSSVP